MTHEPRDHAEHDVDPRGGARLWDGTVREAVLVVPQDAEVWIRLPIQELAALRCAVQSMVRLSARPDQPMHVERRGRIPTIFIETIALKS